MEDIKKRREKIQINQAWSIVYFLTNLAVADKLAKAFDVTKRGKFDHEQVETDLEQFAVDFSNHHTELEERTEIQRTINNTRKFLTVY